VVFARGNHKIKENIFFLQTWKEMFEIWYKMGYNCHQRLGGNISKRRETK
jgi:hypothetical protein